MAAMIPSRGRPWIVLLFLVVVFGLGYLAGGRGGDKGGSDGGSEGGRTGSAEGEIQVWTCSMHPSVRQPEFGLCPLCGMDLIPAASGVEGPTAELELSPAARKLAGIRTTPVERRSVRKEIRLLGRIVPDETRTGQITARFPGRIDRMYVDYSGASVRKGDHLVSVYSPELLSAQKELLQALDALRSADPGATPRLRESYRLTLEAVREKLRLWGLQEDQIREIQESGQASDHLTIRAPMAGVVLEKRVSEGEYVQTGTPLFRLADLSSIWVMLDAYESDLAYLRYGQTVEFETEAFPGDTFEGKVAFIAPVLDPQTRTAKVRVHARNSDGRLRPEMFARARLEVELAEGGLVRNAGLEGKWISPMHPQVVKDAPGTCDICGIPLVPAEEMGYVTSGAGGAPAPLVIPDTAPLITGKRAVVYVADPHEEGKYSGRVVRLGPRAGNVYLVDQGLEEGELVVTQGAFKIDSAVQIQAGPSMMSPEDGEGMTAGGSGGHAGHGPGSAGGPGFAGGAGAEEIPKLDAPAAFLERIDAILAEYFPVWKALSLDELAGAKEEVGDLRVAVEETPADALGSEAAEEWTRLRTGLMHGSEMMAGATDLSAARNGFQEISDALIRAVRIFGAGGSVPARVYHCPMAFENTGADWLQNSVGVENPYYGSMMYRCGEETAVLAEGAQP